MDTTASNFDDLVRTAGCLKYIGEFLVNSQCSGYEAEQHLSAMRLIKAQFDQVDADIQAHPEFAARTEAKPNA